MTGHAVFDPEVTRAALSLMLSCGMYDSSGEWAFDIGLPAKSSISGLLMLVVPNGLSTPPSLGPWTFAAALSLHHFFHSVGAYAFSAGVIA